MWKKEEKNNTSIPAHDFQLLTESASRVFYSTGQRADTSCESHAAVRGCSYSSFSDVGAPVIASHTPQSDLLPARQSQRGAPPRRRNRLSMASCRCWLASGAPLTYASMSQYRAACCWHCLYMSMCVQRLWDIVFFMQFDGSNKPLTRPL